MHVLVLTYEEEMGSPFSKQSICEKNWLLKCIFFNFNSYEICVVLQKREFRLWLIFHYHNVDTTCAADTFVEGKVRAGPKYWSTLKIWSWLRPLRVVSGRTHPLWQTQGSLWWLTCLSPLSTLVLSRSKSISSRLSQSLELHSPLEVDTLLITLIRRHWIGLGNLKVLDNVTSILMQ